MRYFAPHATRRAMLHAPARIGHVHREHRGYPDYPDHFDCCQIALHAGRPRQVPCPTVSARLAHALAVSRSRAGHRDRPAVAGSLDGAGYRAATWDEGARHGFQRCRESGACRARRHRAVAIRPGIEAGLGGTENARDKSLDYRRPTTRPDKSAWRRRKSKTRRIDKDRIERNARHRVVVNWRIDDVLRGRHVLVFIDRLGRR